MTCTTRKERAKREGLEDPQDPQCTLGSALHGMLPFIILTGRRPVTRLRLKRETIPSLVKSSVSSHVKHSHCPRAGGDGPRREYSFFPDRGGRGGHAHVEILKGREEGVGSRPGQRLRPGSPRPSRLPGLAPPAGRGPVGPLLFSGSRPQDNGHPSAPRPRAAVCHDEGALRRTWPRGEGEQNPPTSPRVPPRAEAPIPGRDDPRRLSDVWSLCPPGKSSHVPADMLNGNRRWSLSPHERAGHAPTRRSGYAGTSGNKICLHGAHSLRRTAADSAPN